MCINVIHKKGIPILVSLGDGSLKKKNSESCGHHLYFVNLDISKINDIC